MSNVSSIPAIGETIQGYLGRETSYLLKEVDEKLEERLRKFEAEGCGVCEKSGADVFWYSPVSQCAHSICYEQIKSIEADLTAKINASFKNTIDRNIAHARAIQAVKNELGGVSIQTFLKTQGFEKLKAIFDSSGVKAALTRPKLPSRL